MMNKGAPAATTTTTPTRSSATTAAHHRLPLGEKTEACALVAAGGNKEGDKKIRFKDAVEAVFRIGSNRDLVGAVPSLGAVKAAETYLPVLESKEGIPISMDDLDGLHTWSFKYRFWPNNNSRMYVLENTGEFVNTHGLQLGDFIMVYQDNQNQHYVIQAKKASDDHQDHVNSNIDLTKNSAAANELVLQDYEPIKSTLYYPTMDHLHDSGMSFVYDTTFSDDSPLDFLCGSSSTTATSYSRIGSLDNFGSVENLSLDDFY
ncbi:B3 domain-containing transcription factor FUS3-like [Carica papaya]|uniref:B3 domain-containing transcription factor FUS3-like n=1 Tax=Carica papaya TaxID=3649 RepID=UPI000B8C7CA6|nr:B3 domain-containing transcription factor FUS3-like [Carica papaya]